MSNPAGRRSAWIAQRPHPRASPAQLLNAGVVGVQQGSTATVPTAAALQGPPPTRCMPHRPRSTQSAAHAQRYADELVVRPLTHSVRVRCARLRGACMAWHLRSTCALAPTLDRSGVANDSTATERRGNAMAQGTTTTGTTTMPLLRGYSPASGDHFYTTSTADRDNAVAKLGYISEDVACHVFPAASAGTTPLLRAYSPASGDHFYTTSTAERDNAVAKLGYISEDVACHVLPAASAGTTPLLRAYSPASGDHFYTTSTAERDNAVAKLGYISEDVACHVYPQPLSAKVTTTKVDEQTVVGKVIEVLPNDYYKVEIDADHTVLGHYIRMGTAEVQYARIVVGDVVRVVLSPFNPARGRLYAPGQHE